MKINEELRKARGIMTVDYTPEAVTRRLRQVDELRRLCLDLAGPRLKMDWRRTPADVPDRVKEQQSDYRVNAKDESKRKKQP